MKQRTRMIQLCVLFILGHTMHVSAAMLAITSPATSSTSSFSDFSLGYRFNVGTQPLSVTSLGTWDSGGNGLEVSAQMAIWDLSGTQLTPTVVVPSGTGADQFISGFRFEDLASPLLLSAGTGYVVGFRAPGITAHNSSFTLSEGPVFNTPFVNFVERRINGGGFSYPNSAAGGGTAWEASFLFNVVPEPSGVALLSSGVVALAVCGSKRMRRRLRSARSL